MIFGFPLDRRSRDGEETEISFEAAITELEDIVNSSNEGTRGAKHVEGQEAKIAWWKERKELDTRMGSLLEGIEHVWLGAFKVCLTIYAHALISTDVGSPQTIFMEPPAVGPKALKALRTRLAAVFERGLLSSQGTKTSRLPLHDSVLECISALTKSCRDEELGDFVHLVHDVYQFHDTSELVGLAEVDVDQVGHGFNRLRRILLADIQPELVCDIREALEKFHNTSGEV